MCPLVGLEDAVPGLGRNAVAIVDNVYPDPLVIVTDGDPDLPAPVAEGIRQQIPDYLPEPHGVCVTNRAVLPNGYFDIRGYSNRRQHLCDDRARFHRLNMDRQLPDIGPGGHEEILNQVAHLLGLVDDQAEEVAALCGVDLLPPIIQLLGHTGDDGQRRAHFMADRGDEVVLRRDKTLEALPSLAPFQCCSNHRGT